MGLDSVKVGKGGNMRINVYGDAIEVNASDYVWSHNYIDSKIQERYEVASPEHQIELWKELKLLLLLADHSSHNNLTVQTARLAMWYDQWMDNWWSPEERQTFGRKSYI